MSEVHGRVAEGVTAFTARVDAVARRAGAAILDVYHGRDVGAFAKTDGSPVTAADLASDAILAAGLRDLEPGAAWVSEEGTADLGDGGGDKFWLVDPLDGTREFLAGNGEFCICVALVEGGRPVYGLVHAPVSGATYFASDAGGGAYLIPGAGAAPKRLPARYGVSVAKAGLRVGVSRHHRGERTERYLSELDAPAPVPMGSALKFCAIAAGTLDLYVRHGPTMPWDTAAGQCILEAVGLGVYDLDRGHPLRYDEPARPNPAFLAGPRPS